MMTACDEYISRLTPPQRELVDRVMNNISRGKTMQTVLLPNGGGKTLLSLALALLFCQDKRKVLLYSNSEIDKWQLRRLLGNDYESEALDDICFAHPDNTKDVIHQHFDIAITDSIRSTFDNITLSDFYKKVRGFDPETIEKLSLEPSSAQKSLCALHYIQQIIERDEPYVISFELNNIEDIGYIPLLAYRGDGDDDIVDSEVISSGADEYDTLLKRKRQAVLSGGKTSQIEKIDEHMKYLLNTITERVKRIESEIQQLNNDMALVKSTVAAMNEEIGKSKNTIQVNFDLDNDAIISGLINKMIEALTPDILKLKQQRKYRQIHELVKERLGNEWNKMSDESQMFLVTAKFLYSENMSLGDYMDYSSVCLLASKAFEVELAKRFLCEYQNYLLEKGVSEENWPRGIVAFDKGTGSYRRMKVDEFTLGSCPYIFGLHGKANDKSENRKYFDMYCKEKLLIPEVRSSSQLHVEDFDRCIRRIKNKYRNPAAHKNRMNIDAASACMDYILDVERVLKRMLEVFAY